jgi:hypothetical protein
MSIFSDLMFLGCLTVMSPEISLSFGVFLQWSGEIPARYAAVAVAELVEHGQDWYCVLCELFADGSQSDAARIRAGFQEWELDDAFEVVDLAGEDGFSDAEVFGGVVEIGVSWDCQESSDAEVGERTVVVLVFFARPARVQRA